MPTCDATLPVAYGDPIVCDREVDDAGQHSDSPIGPAGRDGNPITIAPEQHYCSGLQTAFTVEEPAP